MEEKKKKQESPYYAQLQQVMERIERSESFDFDLDSDLLYRQYREQYTRAAEQSRKDTMGRAAALTGGYGSTYAETAAAQAYDREMDKLHDRVPEIYETRRKEHDAAQDALYEKWRMLSSLYEQDLDEAARTQERDYERAMDLLEAGILPDAELLERASIDPAAAASLQAYYLAKQRGFGGGGKAPEEKPKEEKPAEIEYLTADEMEEIKRALRRYAAQEDWWSLHRLYAQTLPRATNSQRIMLEGMIDRYGAHT